MPESHDAPQIDLHLGPLRLFVHSLFVHPQRFPPRWQVSAGPLAERGETFEDEEPWRDGHSIVVRFPFTRRGFAVGYWDLPIPGRIGPAFADTLLDIRTSDIVAWQRPSETTGQTGTAYEDTPGVVVVQDADDLDNVIPWPGERQ